MSKKIDCPVCQFTFAPDLDSSGMCTCPSCESTLLWGTGQNSDYDFVTEFEECVIEASELWEQVKGLDDASLEDEVAHFIATEDFMKGTFAIFAEMESVGYMAFDTRKKAEGAYILMHTNKYFGFQQ